MWGVDRPWEAGLDGWLPVPATAAPLVNSALLEGASATGFFANRPAELPLTKAVTQFVAFLRGAHVLGEYLDHRSRCHWLASLFVQLDGSSGKARVVPKIAPSTDCPVMAATAMAVLDYDEGKLRR